MNELRQALKFYIEHFSWIDWVSYSWIFLLFLFMLFVSIYFIGRSKILGILLLFFSLVFFGVGVFFVGNFLDSHLRTRSIEVVSQQRLSYTDALVVVVEISNLSKKNFKHCRVRLKFHYFDNGYKKLLNSFKAFEKASMVVENLQVGETRRVNTVIDGFRANREYNITTNSECF